MHLYTSNERHAWFHLHGNSRPARSASKATKYKMKKSCPQWNSNPQPWDLKSDALPTEIAGLVECCPFKWSYYIHVLPTTINTLWPSPIMSGFHGAFATGVACQQGTLTLPDTWFRPPFWDLLMLQLLRPNSSNLPCLYLTLHLEYPLVLSRFCL